MKKFNLKHLLLLVVFANCSALLKAAVTFPMDYNNFFAVSAINSGGTSLETGNAYAIGTWVVGNAGTNAVSPTVSDNNLNYSNYIDNNTGKKIALASLTTGSTARTSAFTLTTTTTDLTSGPYYLSFLINVSSVTGSALNIISFGNGNTGGTLRGRLYIKAVTGGYVLGATIDGSPLSYDSKDTLKVGTTNLIVMKHKIDLSSATAGSGTTSIYVNPTLGAAEPAAPNATASETAAVTNLDCVKSIVVSQNIGVAAEIGGLRLGSSWEDVVKLIGGPKLTIPTVSGATSITETGFTANWTPIANALSYIVKVYKNGGLITSVNASGQATSSAAVTGLSNFLLYTYTVTAVGDVTNYSNSDASSVQKVVLPLNYITFFAPTAVGSGETSLETGNASVVNTWALAGTANGVSPAISTSDMSFSSYIDNNASKKITFSPDIIAQRTSLFYMTSSVTDLTAGIYYISFLLKVNTPPATSGSTLLSFVNSNTGGQRGRLNIMGFGAGYQLAASITGSSAYYSSTLSLGTTYLVVMKHEISVASATAGEGTTSIFINPALGSSEPSANATKTESGITSLDCVKGIAINQQPGLNAEIAGLRFSSTWDEVAKSSIPNGIATPKIQTFKVSVLSSKDWLVDLSTLNSRGQLTVVNMQGQTVVKRVVNGSSPSVHLNTNLPKGLYVVTLQAENKILQTKVLSK